MEYLMTLFAIILAGAFGSFLNVVVWRLPHGMSLVRPGSHCPKCGHAIRPGDNIPLFGWLRLRGKCRDCKCGISMRYPLIEAVCMLLGGLLASIFLIAGWPGSGTNSLFWDGLAQARLAMSESPLLAPDPIALLPTACIPVAAWFFYFYLVLAFGLIEYDQKRIPGTLRIAAIVLLLISFSYSWILSSPLDSGLRTGENFLLRALSGAQEGFLCGMLTLPLAALPWCRTSVRPPVRFLHWWPDWLIMATLTGSYFAGLTLPSAWGYEAQHATFLMLLLTTLFINMAWVTSGKTLSFLTLFVISLTLLVLTACG
ncbi:MAG: prepilin peptidase [Planctomycetia bacterium]|nr:prepilin peptidase [Planctomycetia bacterium]